MGDLSGLLIKRLSRAIKPYVHYHDRTNNLSIFVSITPGKVDSAKELIDAGVQMDLRDNFGHK
jgi:hypothetical protein